MVVFLTGASGFIGKRLAAALAAAGHEVVRAQRGDAPGPGRAVHVDFVRDVHADVWLPRLSGVDAVINAAGILRETDATTFEQVHTLAPIALFDACARQGIAVVVQISALGADGGAASRYHLSKKAADDHLASLPVRGYIVQPSLVYGRGGTSAQLFDTLAAMPVILVPGDGAQRVQPVHVADLVDVVRAMIEDSAAASTRVVRVPVVGPEALRLSDFLARLRSALRLPRAPIVAVPMTLVRLAARINDMTRRGLLDSETLGMLERGNTGDAGHTQRWLRRAPRAVEQFIADEHVRDARMAALLGWLLPVLRASVAVVWIVTGVISLGLYPTSESYALLARVGVTGVIAPPVLYGAAVLDLALGAGVVLLRRRRWLWLVQIAVMLGYTALITWKLPEFWLHPYGPLLKNVPMLAAIWLLFTLEERR